MRAVLTPGLLAAAVLLAAALAGAQAPLRVATKVTPPFAMKTADGSWEGLSIELWTRIATAEELEFEFVEMTLPEMLTALEQGTVDVAAAALSVTAEREQMFDFSHSFLPSGLGIATTRPTEGLILRLIGKLFSREFLSALLALATVLLVCGALVWLFERRKNPDFGGKGLEGIGAGFWFSAVTMTTVGYGDKAPRTLGGRLVTLVWMFASIVVISGYTAAIASSLTVDDLASIRGAEDLPGRRVVTVADSTGAEWLREHGVTFTAQPSVEAALAVLAARDADAVVYDQPLLRYLIRRQHEGDLIVLPRPVRLEGYAFAMPTASPLAEMLNRRVLDATSTDIWHRLVERWIGS